MSPLVERKRSKPPRAPRGYSAAIAIFNMSGRLRGSAHALALIAAIFLLAAAVPAAFAAPRILAFGDSLTAGFGLSAGQAFPARLETRLKQAGVAAQVINGGVSGDTSAGGLARLDWALADRPDVVLLELGANDALRGIDPKLTYANLDKILTRLKASRVKVLLLGMLAPPNWGRDYQTEFDAIYPRLAAKYEVPLYPFFLDGVATVAALNQEDGLHPNAEGVDRIAERIAPYVQRLLAGNG